MDNIIIPIKVLVETPVSQLYTNTTSGFDTKRQQSAGRVQIIQKIFIAAPSNGAVEVIAKTRSSAKMYHTRMFFEDIEYMNSEADDDGDELNVDDNPDDEVDNVDDVDNDEPDDSVNNGQSTQFTASDGQKYTIEPVRYGNSDVKVSCTCLDFYYRFSVWNSKDGSLLGNPPPPYIRKSDSNRKPLNPNRIPGLCKHLISLTDELRQEKFLV